MYCQDVCGDAVAACSQEAHAEGSVGWIRMRNTEAERAGALPEGEAIPEWWNSGSPPDTDDPMAGLELPEDLDCLEDDGLGLFPCLGTGDAIPCAGDDADDPMAGLELPDDLDCLEDAEAPDESGPRYVKARTFERVDLPERPRTHRHRRKPAAEKPGPTEAHEAPKQPAEEAESKRPAITNQCNRFFQQFVIS